MLLLGLAFTLAGCSPERKGESRPARPNVILISLDTLRADRLNSYGYERHVTSPNIDALVRDGVIHQRHISASPWTTPSHMSLLTSLNPASHGVVESFGDVMAGVEGRAQFARLADSRVTLAELLSAAGYRTGAFTGGVTVSPAIGFDQGFGTYRTGMFKMGERSLGEMLGWLTEVPDRPFFLFWHTFEVHAPYLHGELLPHSRDDLRTELERQAAALDEITYSSVSDEAMRELLRRHDAYEPIVCWDLYDGGVAAADRWVGRLLRFLRDRDLYEDTLIALTSDHGEEFAEHHPGHFYGRHGDSVFDELVRVPLVVKLPRSEHAGVRVDQITRAIDVMPTILDVVGVEGYAGDLQGRTLTRMWKAPAQPENRLAIIEGTAFGPEMKGVRTGRHKLVLELSPEQTRAHGRALLPAGPVQARLFDLLRDPAEQIDLLSAAREADAAVAADLETALRDVTPSEPVEVQRVILDDSVRAGLKALGYVE